MSNYPTGLSCRCDGFDRVNGGYPLRQCLDLATHIVTTQDGDGFCRARKVCDKHAAQLRQQVTVEILADEAIEATR